MTHCELDDILEVTKEDVDFLSIMSEYCYDIKSTFRHVGPDGQLISVFNEYEHVYMRTNNELSHEYLKHNYPIFQKLADACKNIDGRSTLDEFYFRSQFAWVAGYLPFHKDPRDCVLCIPMVDIELPIKWQEDDGTPICEYKYVKGKPVLINTRIDHGCEENKEMRNFFHISFNEPFDVILDKIKNG